MLSFPVCDRCPYCGSTNLKSLPHEEVTQRRLVAYLSCGDCGTTFEPPSRNARAGPRPHIGDLVVRQRRDHEGFVITLLGASSSQETQCASRAYALTLATRAARPLRVNVWETNDGVTFDLIASYAA